MLIVNADDWGRNRITTDSCVACFRVGGITSASAMMFMEDSERSKDIALESTIDIGLHINFTTHFTRLDENYKLKNLMDYHQRIASYLSANKYMSLFYNPLLIKEFELVYRCQYDEFMRLYNKEPSHINGHHHMHLCANVLFGNIIPPGNKVRRNFTFYPGEKDLFNRYYRRFIDNRLIKKYKCTDYFFDISPIHNAGRLKRIIDLAKSFTVELMVHPGKREEYEFLTSPEYVDMISVVRKSSYSFM